MATTYVDYTATAAQTDFAFSFPYLEDSHVVVEIDGVTKTLTTHYTITTSPSTKIVLVSGATVGQKVRVRRISDPDTNLVDFVDGSVLTESSLDRSYLHNRYLNEEISEMNQASLQKGVGESNWDALTLRVTNVAEPTGIADASTKNYVDTQISATVTGSSTAPTKYAFTGDGSAQFTFSPGITLADAALYEVAIDGVLQESTAAYTIDADNNQINFTSSPPASSKIVVVLRGYAVPVSTGEVTASQLADDAVTSAKIATDAVIADGIAAGAVGSSEIATDAVGSAEIVAGAVGTSELASGVLAVANLSLDANDNVVLGNATAGEALTTPSVSDHPNVIIGNKAAQDVTDGYGNVLVGHKAAPNFTTGEQNVCVGSNAGYSLSAASHNNTAIGAFAISGIGGSSAAMNNAVAVGSSCLTRNQADKVVGMGGNAGAYNSSGIDNTFLGYKAGYTNSTQSDNTYVGDEAGTLSTGAQNTAVGSAANTASNAYSNCTTVGYGAAPSAANEVTLGNASITALKCQVQTVTALSDERIKENVEDIDLGLQFVKGLRGVSYNKKNPADWDEGIKEDRFKGESPDERPEDNDALYRGFIAQEVKALMDAQGVTDWEGWSTDDKGRQNLGVGALVPILVKAVQELSAQVEELKNNK
jgi:hypothetical protein